MDYELNDYQVYNTLLKARRLMDKSASALQLMDLVKHILQREIDVEENVMYIVSGMCRRSVFEYTKRRMSCKLYIRILTTVNIENPSI